MSDHGKVFLGLARANPEKKALLLPLRKGGKEAGLFFVW
jgi:hypothetical protein